MSDSGDARIRVAIIGSGPAGSYAAGHLLAPHRDRAARRPLRAPADAVGARARRGRARPPEDQVGHQPLRATAEHPRLRLFANVEFGRHVTLDDLRRHYHAIVYAVGTPIDRAMGIPGEELPGSYAATDFVGWYNGHPDFARPRLRPARRTGRRRSAPATSRSTSRGCSCSPTPSSPSPTSPTTRSRRCRSSGVREVVVIAPPRPGAGGLHQPGAARARRAERRRRARRRRRAGARESSVDPDADPTAKRNVEILREYSTRTPVGHARRVVLRFLLVPGRADRGGAGASR